MAADKIRRKRLSFRARHRGIKEADMLLGAFADRWLAEMTAADLDWFELLMHEQDVDILAWAMQSCGVPDALQGRMMERLQQLDYFRPLDR